VFESDGVRLPVIISAAVGRGGETMISAQTVEAFWNAVKHEDSDVVSGLVRKHGDDRRVTPTEAKAKSRGRRK